MSILLKRYCFLFIAISAVIIHLVLSFLFLDNPLLEQTSMEGQWIENMSVVFLFEAVALGLYAAYVSRHKGWYLYSYLAFAAACRELNWHKALTSDSILRSRFYVTPEYPLWEKIFGGLFVVTLVYCLVALAKKLLPSIKAVWNGVVHVQAIYACLGLYTVSKILDGFFRYFPNLTHLRDYEVMMRYAEESMEMFGAFFLLYAVVHCVLVRESAGLSRTERV